MELDAIMKNLSQCWLPFSKRKKSDKKKKKTLDLIVIQFFFDRRLDVWNHQDTTFLLFYSQARIETDTEIKAFPKVVKQTI